MTFQRLGIVVALTTVGASLVVDAADWPQWRGPQRHGVSQETGLLKQWPADGPKLLWQVNDIGHGYVTVAVVGTRLYTLANRGLDNEFVAALSAEDGKVVWTTRLGNVGNPGGLVAADFKSGEIRWQSEGIGAASIVLPMNTCTCTARTEGWHWSRLRLTPTEKRDASRLPANRSTRRRWKRRGRIRSWRMDACTSAIAEHSGPTTWPNRRAPAALASSGEKQHE
jgi:hypothetical protein